MKREQGFSLAELLVALAITALLVVLLANVVSATLTAWQQGRTRLDTFSNARQVISRLGDEISAAVAAKGRIEFVENSPALATAPAPTPQPQRAENVFFVAPYPNAGAGDLCVVAYRHNPVEYRLERAFLDSAAAWAVGTSRYTVAGSAGALAWRTVATGVVEFEIRAYSQQNLDAGDEPPSANLKASWNSAAATDPMMDGKTPRRIVLRFRVVDDRTATRLASLPAGSAPYEGALRAGAREFFADFSLPSP
jgi:prepilin-type N-terminal cleavage/methylation domain-containing protein